MDNINFMEEKYPFHVQLHLTDKCNLKCKHCYEGERKIINEWTYPDLDKVIIKLEDCFQKWNVDGEISLVGGEPTMWPYLSKLLYRLYNSKYIKRMAILTNGICLSDDIKKAIIETKPTIQVSIDGINQEKHEYIRGKGTYSKAINTIKYLVQNDVQVFVHYVISEYSVPITTEFVKYMDNLGVSQITFSRDVPIGSSNISMILSKKELQEVFEQLNSIKKELSNSKLTINTSRPLWAIYGEEGRCPVAIQTITILPDGTVLPCRRLPINIGNIKNDTLFNIWYTSEVLWNLRNRKNINTCGKCKLLDNCGGARCIAYAVSNDYMGSDPQCWLH